MTEPQNEAPKRPVAKEKLRSIMEAASALTALGDEESEGSRPSSPKEEKQEDHKEVDSSEIKDQEDGNPPKRYLPEHKKPDAAPTFPEKLMNLMRHADKEKDDGSCCVAWLEDGKSFVIRNPDEFTRKLVPQFFKATKFSSFTRKLYRWGFRQINRGIGPDDPIIFGNEFFQRDDAELMSKMRSITAAGTRKAEVSRHTMFGGMKRQAEDGFDDGNQKRMLFDHFMHQKNMAMAHNPGYYGGHMSGNGSLPLTNALRSSMGMGSNHMMHMNNSNGMKPYEMMNHSNHNGNGLMNQFMPGNGPSMSGNNPNPGNQSTAEIVNAAIAALRYAN